MVRMSCRFSFFSSSPPPRPQRGDLSPFAPILSRVPAKKKRPAGRFAIDLGLTEKCFVHSSNGFVGHFLFNQNGDRDLARGDHGDVDARFIQRTEHLARRARVRLHAGADHGNLGHRCVARHRGALETKEVFEQLHRLFGVALRSPRTAG